MRMNLSNKTIFTKRFSDLFDEVQKAIEYWYIRITEKYHAALQLILDVMMNSYFITIIS